MINGEKLVNTTSAFIKKNLLGDVLFQNTSGQISYIHYNESQKIFDNDSKTFE